MPEIVKVDGHDPVTRPVHLHPLHLPELLHLPPHRPLADVLSFWLNTLIGRVGTRRYTTKHNHLDVVRGGLYTQRSLFFHLSHMRLAAMEFGPYDWQLCFDLLSLGQWRQMAP
ncbi:hypothetical protein ACFX19_014256 [Malus domestica]